MLFYSKELKEDGRKSRRSSTASGGRRSRLGSECLEIRNVLADRIQVRFHVSILGPDINNIKNESHLLLSCLRHFLSSIEEVSNLWLFSDCPGTEGATELSARGQLHEN